MATGCEGVYRLTHAHTRYLIARRQSEISKHFNKYYWVKKEIRSYKLPAEFESNYIIGEIRKIVIYVDGLGVRILLSSINVLIIL